jgi:antitoxin Phd
MAFWQVHDAKARFSKFLDDAIKKGPQVVTRRGTKAAVLVPYEEWRRLQEVARPGLKELLLSAGPRLDDFLPERRTMKRRAPVEFS